MKSCFPTAPLRHEGTQFKMTELGPIPSDWEVKRLGEVCEKIRNGYNYNFREHGKYPMSRIETISTGEINYSRVALIDEEPPCEYQLKVGDILYSHINSLPYIGNIAQYDGAECLYHGMNLLLLRPTDATDHVYLKYLLKSEPMRNIARTVAKVAINQASISIRELSQFLLSLPPLPEQRRIAAALSDVDELIGALGKLVEKKRAIKTGAMQQLLTGKRRLPGFGGKKFKQTDLGPIPSDWEVKRLGEIFSMLRNNTYARESLTDDGGKVFNVHYGDILVKYGAMVNFERDEVPCLKAGIKPNKDMLQDGDLIFADTAEDEMVGKAVEVAGVNGRQAVAGLHTILCRPNADTFAHGFLGYFVNSAAYHNQLLPLITGTKVSSVSRAGFASTYVCIPSLPEQRAIAAVLSDMDAEIAALEAEKRKVEAIKQGMMQELLTGKTRLKGE